MTIDIKDFEKMDMRTGKVVKVQDFPEARKPSYKICVDFGEDLGKRWSVVQATNYEKEELMSMDVIAVVNLPSKNIAGFKSQILLLGALGKNNKLSLLTPSKPTKAGEKVF